MSRFVRLAPWVVALAGLISSCAGPAPPSGPTQAVSEALGAPKDVRFRRATAPRAFEFPADHGPHEEFEIEWWYFTGHLATTEGRSFGFQLTFFRRALAPPPEAGEPPRRSAWATRQVYLAHFALSDLDAGRFTFGQRLARGAVDLAGAEARPFRVWVAEWSAATQGAANDATGLLPLHLQAGDRDVALDLVLGSGKPLVLHGDRGLSRKGGDVGHASYYYSFPRLETRGTVTTGGRTQAVTGSSWMDREWSSGSLGPDQVGWDWFSMQLDDGRELMLFELRGRDGVTTAGTLVAADGASRSFTPPADALTVLDHWTSPHTGARYPSGWRWRLPELALDLELRPLLADQELDLGFRYWEGAVAVHGVAAGGPVAGRGYVELTGYGDRETPSDLRGR